MSYMSHKFSMDIGWVHIAVPRLNDVCGICMPHSVCTTVYNYSFLSHFLTITDRESQSGMENQINYISQKFETHSITITK